MKLEGADTLGVLPAGSVCRLGVFAMCLALLILDIDGSAMSFCSEIWSSAELNNYKYILLKTKTSKNAISKQYNV